MLERTNNKDINFVLGAVKNVNRPMLRPEVGNSRDFIFEPVKSTISEIEAGADFVMVGFTPFLKRTNNKDINFVLKAVKGEINYK